jgi:NADPH:quinone reductase
VRAAICRALGPPEMVEVADVEAPSLGPGQVRVRVDAASVNFPDVLMVAGEYQIKLEPPFVPGSELAGEVIEVADDVASVAVGTRVSATALHGAFAEEAVVASSSVTPIPDGVDGATAAASGVAHRTANHTVRSVARLQAGERLVVLGAGGGVGLATVQLGALMDAEVIAVASSAAKLEVAAALGATTLINHRDGDVRAQLKERLPDGTDVVVDPVGGDLAEPALRSLRRGGRFVTVGYASGTIPRIPLNLVLLKGIAIIGFEYLGFVTHNTDEAMVNDAALLELLGAGKAVPHIGARFPLNEAAAALRYVADGRAIGKVVLDVEGQLPAATSAGT